MKKIVIAVPCMDQVPAQFASSLATLTKVEACIIAFEVGSLIYTSREHLAAEAIRREADYIMWFDSDMVFAPDTLQRLMADIEKLGEGAIVSGLYFRRMAPFSPVLHDQLDIDEEGKATWKDTDEIPDEIFEVAGCGFGCVLAPTNAFMDVMGKFGCMFTPINGTGEDLSFCWRARQCGWKIYCDPTIALGHVAHHMITRDYWQDYKEFSAQAAEQK